MRPRTRAETRRVAEIQLSIKVIDAEIQAASSAEVAKDLHARRAEAQAELCSITEITSVSHPGHSPLRPHTV